MYPQWYPINFDNLNDVPNLDSFTENGNGLSLILDFKSGNRLVHFDDYFALRVIDEGKAFKTLEQQNFDGRSWLFVSTNSDFIDWFNDQSSNIYENECKHYIIVSQHKFLEILSAEMPIIS